MKVFLEKQFIKPWWNLMFIFAIILIVVGTAYYATRNAEEDTALIVSAISILIALPLVFALLYLRLETRIDELGILTYFKPFGFTKKFFSWDEISKCYVRKYEPVGEYGGWGLRGVGRNSKAYNVWGDVGIQINTKEGGKFLIGTQNPEDAKNTIEHYHPFNTTYES